MLDIGEIPHSKWLYESEKHFQHAGSWSLEHLGDTNRITRNYSTAYTLGSLHQDLLQIVIVSHTQIETGKISIIDIEQTHPDKILVSLLIGSAYYLIHLHAPGVTQRDIDGIDQVHLAELLIDDVGLVHKQFSQWVLEILPPGSLRSLDELHAHVSELLRLPYVTYVASLINRSDQFDLLFRSKKLSLPRVVDFLVRKSC